MSSALRDGAFAYVKKHGSFKGAPGHRAAKAELLRRFPDCSRSEVARAYAQARALSKACYDIGDQCRAEILTREQAEAILAAKFPGFSDEIYGEAVSYGMFISR